MADLKISEMPPATELLGDELLEAVQVGSNVRITVAALRGTEFIAAAPLSGHSIVAVNPAGQLVPADSSNPTHFGAVLGLVANAYGTGDDAVVQTGYPLEHASWSWIPGALFVGTAGQLTQTMPAAPAFAQIIATALTPTRIVIDVQPPVFQTV